MSDAQFSIGVVSFTDPRPTTLAGPRENYIREKHEALVRDLSSAGFRVIDPMPELNSKKREAYGVASSQDAAFAITKLKTEGAEAVVLGCWHWTEPMLPMTVVRELNLPTLLYAEHDPAWAGSVCITAVGASLREMPFNSHALTHERLRGDVETAIEWGRGAAATEKLKRKTVILWGGSYCLRMEHLQDDVPALKSLLIGDILNEDQYVLIRGGEEILANDPGRVDKFIEWLKSNGAKIVYDDAMLTEVAFRKQIGLYLAARDRLAQLESENIGGVSIKCQPECSEMYGFTACLLPSLLPFGCDSEGPRPIVPTVCEGDIKGLLTCAMLFALNPKVPPLFGDLKYISDDYIVISNCGGSSVYYGANSLDAKKALSEVTLSAQCQGAAGGAVGYKGQPGQLTVARLIRVSGDYYMQLGLGESLEITPDIPENIIWGQTWPHIAIDLGVSSAMLTRMAGSNHYSAIPGNWISEMKYACRELGIPIIRIDSDDALAVAEQEILAQG